MLSDSSTFTTTQSSMNPPTTTAIVNSENLFLNTRLCQVIAGAFTWAAIFITGYHVNRRKTK